MKSIYILILSMLISSCSYTSKNQELANRYNHNRIQLITCNYEDYDLYLAIGEDTGDRVGKDYDYFTRGWFTLPSHYCVDATDFFYSGNTDYSVQFTRGAYIHTAHGYYTPGNHDNVFDHYYRLCLPDPLPAFGKDWLLKWLVPANVEEDDADCPKDSYMDYPVRWTWHVDGYFDVKEIEDGIRYKVVFDSGETNEPSPTETYGYHKDSPVPLADRKLIKEVIIPIAPVKGKALEDGLKKWRGHILTEEQKTLLLTIRAIGAAFMNAANETAAFMTKVGLWLDGAVTAVNEGIKCISKTAAAGDAGDLYEILGGKDICTGEKLTLAGRALSSAALIGGSAKFWRTLGGMAGISTTVKKIAKITPEINWDIITILNSKNTKIIEKDKVPDFIKKSFTDGKYETIEFTKPVVLYRVWGQTKSGFGSKELGGFWTTFAPKNKLQAKLDLALVPEWKSTKAKVSAFYFPSGIKVNYGKAAKQPVSEHSTSFLPGGAEQISIHPDYLKQLNEDGIIKKLGELDI